MKRLLLIVLALGLTCCASYTENTDDDGTQSSDNSGFTSGGGFSREADPISRHQQYMNRGL